jgi:predicted PurR-regulated permease PerM
MPQNAMPAMNKDGPVAAAPDAQLRFAASAVIAAIVVGAIYFGRPILVPIALAILLAFALGPIVSLLRRLRAGRVPSVIFAALVAIAIIGALVLFIGSQLARLAADLPRYQHTIEDKIHAVEASAASNGVIGPTVSLLKNLDNQIAPSPATSKIVTAKGTLHARSPEGREVPVPVEIRAPAATPVEIIGNIFRPLIDPLATGGIAIIFVVFILLQKEDLRDRFIWMAGSGDLQRAKTALDDGADRLSRFLLTQTAVNAVFGMLVGAGLWVIGVPHPWLWGLVASIFRFVPYVGVPAAAAMPVLLSLAADPGWSMMLWTAALYLVLEPVTGQLVEPFLYGHSVGLSPVAVVVAATFWTWVWGPVGLLLSTPLTLCVAVLGRHVERLKFLDVLLGNRPPLAEEESFYLLSLAADPDEAARLAEPFLRQHSLCEYYDVALKALILAQADANRGALDAERSASIKAMIEGLIENLSDHEERGTGEAPMEHDGTGSESAFARGSLPQEWAGQPVLCVAGRSALDEAAALLLVHLLERRGVGARVISSTEASPAHIQSLDPTDVRFICLSYLDAGSGTNAHYLMRRLRRRIPDAHVITAFWGFAGDDSRYLNAVAATGCEVVTSLKEAVTRIMASAGMPPTSQSPEVSDQENARTRVTATA